MDEKHILVTGATGYIGGLLIPQLLKRGHYVRALVRDPECLKGRSWQRQVEVLKGDALLPSTLHPALEGVHTAYYLIHSMSTGQRYTELELRAAHNFANAAQQAGVQHIVYLGGLARQKDTRSKHLASRIQTGAALRKGPVPVTEFRAGVIVGSGSTSFEIIRYITEWLPVIVGPLWLRKNVQPIAVQNVLDYLLAALEQPPNSQAVYEIGGLDVMTFGETILRYARVRGLKRSLFSVSGIPNYILTWAIGLLTPVPMRIVKSLLGGLAEDSVVSQDEVQRVFPGVKLLGFDEAVSSSLAELHPKYLEGIWDACVAPVTTLKKKGFFIDHRWMHVNASPKKVFQIFTTIRGKKDWPYLFLSDLETGLTERNNNINDMLEYYRVENLEPDSMLRVHAEYKLPGDSWIEWRVDRDGADAKLSQTAYFAPRGTPGFLYWYVRRPLQKIVLRRWIKGIARRSEMD